MAAASRHPPFPLLHPRPLRSCNLLQQLGHERFQTAVRAFQYSPGYWPVSWLCSVCFGWRPRSQEEVRRPCAWQAAKTGSSSAFQELRGLFLDSSSFSLWTWLQGGSGRSKLTAFFSPTHPHLPTPATPSSLPSPTPTPNPSAPSCAKSNSDHCLLAQGSPALKVLPRPCHVLWFLTFGVLSSSPDGYETFWEVISLNKSDNRDQFWSILAVVIDIDVVCINCCVIDINLVCII